MQKIRKIVNFALHYGIFAWMAAAVVWYLIVSTLHRVISCDEGYYLMGFLRGQDIDGQATDFHFITRALCRPFADDDIMVFRWVRLALNVLGLVAFTLTSYEWLSKKKGLTMSRWLYYPMMALAGAMSFTFAAPTLSYDSIEVIVALLMASMLFVHLTTEKAGFKAASAIGFGFLMWFAFTNYPPAGVSLIILFLVVFLVEDRPKKWQSIVLALLGFGVSLLVYHCFIHDLKDWFADISKVFVTTFTETSPSGHDSDSLVSAMLKTIVKTLVVMVPVVVLSALAYSKLRFPKGLLWGTTMIVCMGLVVFRKEYQLQGTLILLPVALQLGKLLANEGFRWKAYLLSGDFWVAFAMVAVPLAGVFGTNQAVMTKAVVFTPFWMIAYCLLSARMDNKANYRMHLVFTTLLLGAYVYLGNFQRYHCYYTPRSSKYEVIGANRPQRVLVSEYQQQYYKDVFDSLYSAGCKPDDLYIAFGENQMTVYLAGGHITGRLVYHDVQYKTFDAERPKAFVLFRCEEQGVIERFGKADWGFPKSYRRMEMRPMSQNLGDQYRTVIYVRDN